MAEPAVHASPCLPFLHAWLSSSLPPSAMSSPALGCLRLVEKHALPVPSKLAAVTMFHHICHARMPSHYSLPAGRQAPPACPAFLPPPV